MAKPKTKTANGKRQAWYVTLERVEVCIQKTYPRGACNFETFASFEGAQARALEFLYDLALDCAQRAGCIKHAKTFAQYMKLCEEKLT